MVKTVTVHANTHAAALTLRVEAGVPSAQQDALLLVLNEDLPLGGHLGHEDRRGGQLLTTDRPPRPFTEDLDIPRAGLASAGDIVVIGVLARELLHILGVPQESGLEVMEHSHSSLHHVF